MEIIKKAGGERSFLEESVMFLFFAFPEKQFSFTEILGFVGGSKGTLSGVVEKLIKQGFLLRKIVGKSWQVSVNLEHKFNQTIKISHNLFLIFASGVLDLIKQKFNSKAIVLFGSYRKGDDNSESDVDIGVEVFGEQKVKIIEFAEIKKMGFRKNVRVNVHLFSRKEIADNLFSNIANGIVLDGFLEVKK